MRRPGKLRTDLEAPPGRDGELRRLQKENERLAEELRRERKRFLDFARTSRKFAVSLRGRLGESRRLEIQNNLLRRLEELERPEDAGRKTLEILGETFERKLGVLWECKDRVLRCAGIWRSGAEVGPFERACRESVFSWGEGLPGRCWAQNTPLWSAELRQTEDRRFRFAAGSGPGSSWTFPLWGEGGLIWVAELFSEEPEEGGESLLRMLSAVGDQVGRLVERRRSERALRESESNLRLAQKATGLGYWRRDLASGDFYASSACKAHFGRALGEPFGYEDLFRSVHPKDRERLRRTLEQAIRDRSDYEAEFRVVSPDGPVRRVYGRGGVVREPGSFEIVGTTLDITRRKRAEEASRYLATLVRSTNDAIVGLDEEFNIASWNRGAEKVFGYRAGEMVGRFVLDLIPPEHHEKALNNRERLEHGEEIHDYVARFFRKSGEELYVSMSISPVNDGADNSGFVWVMQDITGRRRSEKALRESEARFRRIFEQSNDMVFVLDPEREKVLDANERACRVLGYTREELLGLPLSAVHPREMPALRDFVRTVLASGEGWADDFVCKTKAGRNIPCEISASPVELNGRVRVLALVRDVTERRDAEKALRASEERLRRAVEIETVGITFFTTEGRITDSNDAFLKMSGYTREDFAKEAVRWDVMTTPEAMERSLEAIEELQATGRTTPYEKEYIRKDGSRRWALFAARRLNERENVEFIIDITARKRIEQERERLARETSSEWARLAAVLGQMPTGVFIADLNGRLILSNEEARRICGGSVESLEELQEIESSYPAGEPFSAEQCLLNRALKSGEVIGGVEHYISRPNGEKVVVNASATPVRDAEGRIVAAVNAFVDITEKKRSEEILRENEQWLRLAQEAASTGTWEWDLKGKNIRWSKEHYELFGLDPNEPLTFEKWWKDIPPEDVERIEGAWERCAGGEEEVEVEYRVVQARETRWMNARGRTDFDAAGRPEHVLGITVDITGQRRAAEQQERLLHQEWTVRAEVAEREKISRDLHDYVAHEIGVAHQNLQLFEALAESDPERARQKLQLAKEMVKSSLDSTRQLSAELRRLDAEEDLGNALEDLAEALVRPRMGVAISLEGNVYALPGRVRGQIYLILREALTNAVRHSKGGEVSVEVSVENGSVVGRVSDDGEGFEVGSVKPAKARRGVGLNSMRERAELLGGELYVNSAPGEGTTIEVRVPLNLGRGRR